jgi:hypothetical protein
LHFTYHKILNNADLNTYVFAPVVPKNWQRMLNHCQLFLGELAGTWVKIFEESSPSYGGEKLVWWLTKSLRERDTTALTQFAALLYALYKQEREKPADILNQTWAQDAYTNIKHYPNGEEISQSFAAFTAFLNYQNLADLTGAQQFTAALPDTTTAIRPTVLIALTRLGEIGAEVATPSATPSATPIATLNTHLKTSTEISRTKPCMSRRKGAVSNKPKSNHRHH